MKNLVTGLVILFAFLHISNVCFGQNYPAPVPGDFVMKDFKFQSGESLPELKMHYVTIGQPAKNSQGMVTNAVIVLHGTGGNHKNFLNRQFGEVLFKKGGLLDA